MLEAYSHNDIIVILKFLINTKSSAQESARSQFPIELLRCSVEIDVSNTFRDKVAALIFEENNINDKSLFFIAKMIGSKKLSIDINHKLSQKT